MTMTPIEVEVDDLKRRLARSELILYVVGVVCVLLFVATCSLAIGHGGSIARLQGRLGDPQPPAPPAPNGAAPPPIPAPSPSTIEAAGFVVKDPDGNPRIMMGVNPDDSTAFVIRGRTAATMCGISTRPDGSIGLAFLAGGEAPILSLTVRPTGEAGIVVGRDHKVAIAAAPDDRGARIVVSGDDGRIIGQFP